MSKTEWPYPGSRWWKFDFHTHTPASTDYIKSSRTITPQAWLKTFMAAEIDCVAVTDHNSGTWIDKLRNAYVRLQEAAHGAENGFRELTIFPGVEISANGGVHILAIFGPEKQSSDIDSLLGLVESTLKCCQ